jgi:hypothetical protein
MSFHDRLRKLGASAGDLTVVDRFMGVARTHGFRAGEAEALAERYFAEIEPKLAAGAIDVGAALDLITGQMADPKHVDIFLAACSTMHEQGIDAIAQQSVSTLDRDAKRAHEIEKILRTDPAKYHREGLADEYGRVLARLEAGGQLEKKPERAPREWFDRVIAETQDILRTDYPRYWADAELRGHYETALAAKVEAESAPAALPAPE